MKSSNIFSNLLNSLRNKEVQIGIIGMGYVGLPLAIAYAEKGFKVLGIDIDKSKVEKINNAKSYINHIPSGKLKNLIDSKYLKATNVRPDYAIAYSNLLFNLNPGPIFPFHVLSFTFFSN